MTPCPWVGRVAGGVLATLALLAGAVAVSVAWHHPGARPVAEACCHYSAARLARGEVWTLFGSALLLPRLHMIGSTTVMTTTLFVPYALAVGGRPALRAFFAGHVVTTLLAAAGILTGAALGWAPAIALRGKPDVGASAGLAAAGGALCVLIGGRRRGPLLVALLGGWFGVSLLRWHRLVEIEHLVAVVTGGATEWARHRLG